MKFQVHNDRVQVVSLVQWVSFGGGRLCAEATARTGDQLEKAMTRENSLAKARWDRLDANAEFEGNSGGREKRSMKSATRRLLLTASAALALAVVGGNAPASAATFIQCPGDGVSSFPRDAVPDVAPVDDIQCVHLTGGDGFARMGDGKELYLFGYADVTGMPEPDVQDVGVFAATYPSPTITTREGQELYLTLTNVGTVNRPDLFDPHTVHNHGFPNIASIMDGVPEVSVGINQGASLTYYYNNVHPGTYIYHCHVEATEHMQMGMLGILNVEPAQNLDGYDGDLGTISQKGGNGSGPLGYVYNDGDGSTAFDVEMSLQLSAFHGEFHEASFNTQPLPFAAMIDDYPMINGRGYPDTVVPGDLLPPPADSTASPSPQFLTSALTADVGQRILLRITNVSVVHDYSFGALGLPMQVIGRGARMLRGTGQSVGENIFEETNLVTIAGGEAVDVLIDTSSVEAGTYFLYTTNLNYLSNNEEDFGGMMTEIVLNP